MCYVHCSGKRELHLFKLYDLVKVRRFEETVKRRNTSEAEELEERLSVLYVFREIRE